MGVLDAEGATAEVFSADMVVVECTQVDIGEGMARIIIADTGTGMTPEQCDVVCREVLRSGQADWVRITSVKHRRLSSDRIVTDVFTFARSPDQVCEDGKPCVVFVESVNMEPDLTVHVVEKYGVDSWDEDGDRQGIIGVKIKGMRKIEILQRSGAEFNPIYRQFEFQYGIVRQLASLVPNFSGLTSGGNKGSFIFPKERQTVNPLHIRQALQAVGLKLEEPKVVKPVKGKKTPYYKVPPTLTLIAQVKSVIALPKKGPFNKAEMETLRTYFSKVGAIETLQDSDVQLIMDIIKDPRRDRLRAIPKVVLENKPVQDAIIPWFFSVISKPGGGEQQLVREFSFPLYSGLTVEELAPFADQFLEAYRNTGYRPYLRQALARFEFDPSAEFANIYRGKSNDLSTMSNTICLGQAKWRETLLPIFRDEIWKYFEQNPNPRQDEALREALYLIGVMGERAFAEKYLHAMKWVPSSRWDAQTYVTMLKSGKTVEQACKNL